jgi:hypothetical protein
MVFPQVELERSLKGLEKLIDIWFDQDISKIKKMSLKLFELKLKKYHEGYGFSLEDSIFYARQKTEEKLVWVSNYYASNGYSNKQN